MSRVAQTKPRPELPWGSATGRRIKALQGISHPPLAFPLKVAFQFCNETARFGPVGRAHVHGVRSIQDD